jgi:hypothetical protein
MDDDATAAALAAYRFYRRPNIRTLAHLTGCRPPPARSAHG